MDQRGEHESQTRTQSSVSSAVSVSVRQLRLLFEPAADQRIHPLKQCRNDATKSDPSEKIRFYDKAERNNAETIDEQEPVLSPISCVSMKSDQSMDPITVFNAGLQSKHKGINPQSPVSSPPSCISLRSDRSMDPITVFKDGDRSEQKWIRRKTPAMSPVSCLSLKSDRSMDPITVFREQRQSVQNGMNEQKPASCISLKSDRSMDPITVFRERQQSVQNGMNEQKPASCISLKSDRSMDPITVFKERQQSVQNGVEQQNSERLCVQSPSHPQNDLDSIFKALEENIMSFVKRELKKFQDVLGPDYHECLTSRGEKEEVLDEDDDDEGKTRGESFLKLTLDFLRKMKQKKLADYLHNRASSTEYQQKQKSNLRKRFQCVFEGIAKGGNQTLLNQIYTELYITEGGTGEVNEEHEVRQIETTSRKQDSLETIRQEELFKAHRGKAQPVRTVLTKGVAGIGKTVLTQKFTLDWAEDQAHQDIHFAFPFTFRELNVLKKNRFSLVGLIHHFFPEINEICDFEQFKVLFIFDGLDECRLPLDFHSKEILTDVTESTSVDVLLTNLIRGKLLPSAQIWITTRPSAASLIPPHYVDVVTEVRGFSDSKKEEYFRKRFKDKKQANRIIAHIKSSRSIHIMCHIPIFCWINATVLEDMLKTRDDGELPKTLTEMYIHFLVVQTKVKKVKYDKGMETDSHWSPESRKMIESLGKLAFDQLQKGNLIFYESDLAECGIDVSEASVYSGVFTEIFKEERGLYQNKVFCFIHLSVQEFLAALYVHLTFINFGVNLLMGTPNTSETGEPDSAAFKLHQHAVDEALQSPNGHLDLFLRFLLGLSQPANQTFLQGLQTKMQSCPQSNQQTIQYIKKKICDNVSVEKNINLFHCLNELNDCSLVEEIQQYLRSGSLSTDKMSPAQWSALVFILLSSDKDLAVFDLKKYSASEDTLLKLLPVVKASNRVLLSGCNLSGRSCEALASVLSLKSSCLRELDLSNNKLEDAGVKLLSVGLESPNCKLESLSLTGCLITEEGCAALAKALSSNPSHLKELDLSYNHPGDSGVKLLSSRVEDPHCKLEMLRVDHCGKQWLTPGLKKYFCEIELDPNTVSRKLVLSANNKKVKIVDEEQPYPDHPERFEWNQLLCKNGLTGRCYWEVEWSGRVLVSVSYKRLTRRGLSSDRWFGGNELSWGLRCCDDVGYAVCHKNIMTVVPLPASCLSHRIAVYLDFPAGTLSYYRISSDTLTHLHTFNATFTEPLYPGFGFWFDSSACICSL